MKSLRIIFQYVGKYPKLVFLYFSLNLLSAFFSLISLTMLAPFLTLIFGIRQDNKLVQSKFRLGEISDSFYDLLTKMIATEAGKIKALGFLCLIVLAAILLKNLFLYL